MLDTNVLASGLVSTGGSAAHLLTAWGVDAFELVVSEHILTELERTLAKPYFRDRHDEEQVRRDLARLRDEAIVAAVTVVVTGVATQPADDLVLATAVSAAADYLVTGDRKLRALGSFQGVRIVTPREFLDLLDREDASRESG